MSMADATASLLSDREGLPPHLEADPPPATRI
jgi:hypothetical protein